MSIAVDKRRCPQNHPCPSVNVCPTGALIQKGFGLPIIDEKRCTACGMCIDYCPMRAIKEV